MANRNIIRTTLVSALLLLLPLAGCSAYTAKAAGTGNLKVDTASGYSYSDNTLTITDSGSYTISMKDV